jgi:glycosyltransferase involved in cell wall biosynthesis
MNTELKISIITVSYNVVNTIEKTILSVINQTYPNIEYIIIDGGSTDGTIDIIKKYEDKLTYWVSEPDKGIYDAMNKGVIKATGTYCNFMNAGDKFFDENVLLNVFQDKHDEDILSGITVTSSDIWYPPEKNNLSLLFFYKYGLGHQATFINTKLLKEVPYDEKLKIVADNKFFIETLIFKNASYKNIPTKICIYDTTGISSNNRKEALSELREVLATKLPPRILVDYLLFEKYYNPLFRLLYPITQSSFFQKFPFPFPFLLFLKRIVRKV